MGWVGVGWGEGGGVSGVLVRGGVGGLNVGGGGKNGWCSG